MIRCLTIAVTSLPVKAYFSLFLKNTVKGRDSRSLWGPGEGRGAYWISLLFHFIHSTRVTYVGAAELVEHP